MNKQPGELAYLGQRSEIPTQPSTQILDVFENPCPERDYVITFHCPEFTTLCPMTGQPDFAHLDINYIPDKVCIESKSLKLYLFAYRNEGVFHEAVVNRILDDLIVACAPRWMEIIGRFNTRGGIAITVKTGSGKN